MAIHSAFVPSATRIPSATYAAPKHSSMSVAKRLGSSPAAVQGVGDSSTNVRLQGLVGHATVCGVIVGSAAHFSRRGQRRSQRASSLLMNASSDREASVVLAGDMSESLQLQAEAVELRREAGLLEAERMAQHEADRRNLFLRLASPNVAHGQSWCNLEGNMNVSQFRMAVKEVIGQDITEVQSENLLRSYDHNGDGKLAFHEFWPETFLRELNIVVQEERNAADWKSYQEVLVSMQRDFIATEQAKDARLKQRAAEAAELDCQPWVRMVALLPYILPLLDGFKLFGQGWVFYHVSPLAWQTCIAPYSSLPDEVAWCVLLIPPVLMWSMPSIAVKRRLPQLLRFNLNQAFTINLMLWVAHSACSMAQYMTSSTLNEQVDVLATLNEQGNMLSTIAEPSLLPGTDVTLFVLLSCILYSLGYTLLSGQKPDGIPFVSAQAERSLGKVRPGVAPSKCIK